MQLVEVAVAAASDDPITIAGLSAYLGNRPEIKTLAGRYAAEADVLVLCVDIVDAEVIRRLRALAATSTTRTVLITQEVRPEDALSLVECGVIAVLHRSHATEERLTRAVLGAHAGHGMFPPPLLGTLLQQVAQLQQRALTLGFSPSGLGDRERDVLRLLADGFNTVEIAEKLSYSERTVKNILYILLSRLRVRNRSHAVAVAIRAGVI